MTALGHHFVLGLRGSSLSEDERELLSAIRPAGVFVDSDNFDFGLSHPEWVLKFHQLISEAKAAAERTKFIVAIDHEGGRVHRTPAPLTRAPYACEYARYAGEIGDIHGRELAALGVNVMFGPVCDINSNPANPVIGPRAFGSNALEVIESAQAYAAALRVHGIIPTFKHFPGHGDTKQDSHLEIPHLGLELDALRERELKPFAELINVGGQCCIMTTHVQFDAIDPDFPATLSKKIITGILRNVLFYNGVVITDDLDMRAVKEHFTDETVALRTIMAGCDLLLFNHCPERALGFITSLEKELKNK